MAAFLSACLLIRCSARPMSSALPEEALLPPLPLPERPASLSWRDRSSFQASNSAVTCRISREIHQVHVFNFAPLGFEKSGQATKRSQCEALSLSHLDCVLLKYAQLKKDVQLDFAFVEQFLHLTLGLVQLLKHPLDVRNRTAVGRLIGRHGCISVEVLLHRKFGILSWYWLFNDVDENYRTSCISSIPL